MKIDTSILRNELAKEIEVGVTTEDFDCGWVRCAEEVEKAIQRAEKKTMQVDEVPHDIMDDLLEVRITKGELDELRELAKDRDYYKGKVDAYESFLYTIIESED